MTSEKPEKAEVTRARLVVDGVVDVAAIASVTTLAALGLVDATTAVLVISVVATGYASKKVGGGFGGGTGGIVLGVGHALFELGRRKGG